MNDTAGQFENIGFTLRIIYDNIYVKEAAFMNSKLTLSMDTAVIASMKGYASENNYSISQLVENFFKSILSSRNTTDKISPLVQELSGIIPSEDTGEDYIDYLERKYE